ncbi:GNAT family N-acetyltransferase [Nocardioides sp. LHG3406-4]|uniref:GNAT family N-acetyltransferase n=1 Tax=Nocardioides sp. LHG3406-4 TaxID=2804575 RepID=UPI003CED3E52
MSSGRHAPVDEDLIDNTYQGRFELYRGGVLCGWLYYTLLKPNRYALQHTEVDADHQHQGVAGAMVRRVLEEIRARAGTITAICPFVVDFLSRTTTYADLIDLRHPGYSDRESAEAAYAKASG